jgi:Uma2 family endonuclease
MTMSTITSIPHSPTAWAKTAPVPDEERGVIRDASWNLYDRLSDAIGERSLFRVAFDGRDIEIMALGPKHEDIKDILGLFVNELYFGLEIDCRGLGSTTWKRSELGRGIEADLCFYFDPGKLQTSEAAAARDSNDVADYPNPDLAIEIDLSPSKIDRPGIYSALRVAEIWRLEVGSIAIETLGVDGHYIPAESSRFLYVRPEEIVRWVITENSNIRRDWRRRLQDWIRVELKPRVAARAIT